MRTSAPIRRLVFSISFFGADAMKPPHKFYDFDPTNLPADILQALGFLLACSAQTEYAVEMAMAAILGIEAHYSAAITAHMSAPLLDNSLRAVAQIRIDDLDALDRLDELLDAVNEALTKRNSYVHGNIGRERDTNQCFLIRIEARGQLEGDSTPISVNNIKSDAHFILDTGLDLIQFTTSLGFGLRFPASPPNRAHKSKAARKKRRKELLRAKTGK
jgi:hypothetical protein